MPATPARIAKSTVDGIVVEHVDTAIKTTHINAVDVSEIEMFFDNEADAQALLDERWAWQSDPARLRESIELDGSFNLGTEVPLTPAVPTYHVVDDSRGVDGLGAVRSYAANYETDRYAVELIGVPGVPTDDVLSISGDPVTDVSAGYSYEFLPEVTGGRAPYRFTLKGEVPAGLSFNPANGELSGIVQNALPGPLSIQGAPGVAHKGEPFSFVPTVTGGVPLYSFQIDGDLPDGATADLATGEISGTPI